MLSAPKRQLFTAPAASMLQFHNMIGGTGRSDEGCGFALTCRGSERNRFSADAVFVRRRSDALGPLVSLLSTAGRYRTNSRSLRCVKSNGVYGPRALG